MDQKAYVETVVPIMRASRVKDCLRAAVYDTEVYRNYFLAAFRSLDNGQVLTFEARAGEALSPEDRARLDRVMRRNMTIGFNSRNYDLIITMLAIKGYTTGQIKQASDQIIVGNAKPWDMEREYGFKIPHLNHIDLIEVAPGKASLKLYGGRLHTPRMQDLPFDPGAELTPEEIETLKTYCVNDLDQTEGMFIDLLKQIALRARMSEEYGEDLRSKSDAQIAEAVIKNQIEKLRGRPPAKPGFKAGATFKYRMPDFIQFTAPHLVTLRQAVIEAEFKVAANGKIIDPEALQVGVDIGNSTYRLGIGGLHSSEKSVAHVADEDTVLIDRDVTSYYPAIILNQGLAPKHMGHDFLTVYRALVERRLKAKRSGDKVTADTIKITINGSFGKFGSQWSILYSPDLMIQTTVTGQLALLMLIERLEFYGVEVVSGNTDGIVLKVPRRLVGMVDDIVREWEADTGLATEETLYSAVYSRDVNNYLAIKVDGEVKRKGILAEAGLQKNPASEICIDAVIALLTKGTPVSETIFRSRDVRQFVTVRTVNGGAVQADAYLGKAIRWIYSKASPGPILYKTNGNKVARSDGSRALMNLPAEFPADIDHAWYVAETYRLLESIGFRGDADPTFDMIFKD